MGACNGGFNICTKDELVLKKTYTDRINTDKQILRFLNLALWYTYVIRANIMHTFFINDLN